MFETYDQAEIPIPEPLRIPGERAWPYVELSLHVPWFYLVYRLPIEDDRYLKRSIFLSDVPYLIGFIAEGAVVDEVQIVLPERMTGAGRWTMEPLAEIWEGVELAKTGQKARVYVLADRTRYLDSGWCKNESDLRDRQLIFKSPVSGRSSSKQG